MYFEIENTPEHIKRARKRQDVKRNETPKEECPRLILAPFSRPPQVVFDNVLIGTTCERNLEVLNPSKQIQQITLGKALPPGLVIHLPGEYLEVEPETCYCLTMLWTPTQPTALRETIRFTNENRGRYDVVVVLKAVMNVKGKSNQPKFKVSPGKMKRRTGKKSPVAIYKKKVETIYNTMKVKKTVDVVQTTQYKVLKPSNRENIQSYNDCSIDSNIQKCPFDSPNSIDLNFNTSEIFSNVHRQRIEMLHQTYDKPYNTTYDEKLSDQPPNNILKPSNKQTCDTSASGLFDNLTFTPLKSIPSKNDKLDKGPKIILSVHSESDFDDSLDIKNSNKENESHSIICITSSQPPNKWLTVNQHTQYDSAVIETPTIPNKKIPNTSSPKELNSPNFTINTEFSRISDLSFFPQRFSTERKILPKINNETQEIIDDSNMKLSSDTYTKDSPNTHMDYHANQMFMELRQQQYFMKEPQPKMCRQALFKDLQQQREMSEKNYLRPDHYLWHTDLRADTRSPPRSLTPPLQSIPEESIQLSETQAIDRTDKQMTTFTINPINRTFDKTVDWNTSTISSRQTSWSKKAVRAEPELWKVPTAPIVKKPVKQKTKGKESTASKTLGNELCAKVNQTFESNKSINQNISLNTVGNIYSQSFTVDPFLSSTYFYDEEAVDKFEKEFKRWLNYILTPPADLDSNIEQKIDVGKAWIENRNKEVPAAPTKEQVCNKYHNSHRLESLRRSARALLLSPEISQVFVKLNVQIEKKLIAIRNDRNLHLDVGLQKMIMEILLSYNPLWLRIGLEAIYGIILPLKSNSDIDGITTFIIQRMFKNPHLKNKHSVSNKPNMLSPAYMEAIKKFTLKKFFMLVYFLDQAKQKKLISHDPCLFCRNAICKESREIIIRFTRELIAGIGDITKHLRPLGYVVSHKQSYLDEYKYAVHNIAVEIRDGVRLTKVMEIILMKNGLLNQLRTPAISRLQKIHNVQVALNALKEANFVIVGDISAVDIADGHREKTLSLLWQLIHVFRAPLFEKAANVIQTWWRKKYAVIVEIRREEERILAHRNKAASIIQYWWRLIQYNRMVEYKMQQITTAVIVLQKYCRMWLCRSRLKKFKASAVKIAEWYRGAKLIRSAKITLEILRSRREELRNKSATLIQTHARRWLCQKKFKVTLAKIIFVQSMIRLHLVRKWYVNLKKSVIFVQRKYKSKLLMRKEMRSFSELKKSAIAIQTYYRMIKQYRYFNKLKVSVKTVESQYKALLLMRNNRNDYLLLKHCTIKIQAIYRGKIARANYLSERRLIIKLQRKIRAQQVMKRERANFLRIRNAVLIIQAYVKSYLAMKVARKEYLDKKKSSILIQRMFRSYLHMKSQRCDYLQLRKSAIVVQTQYRSLLTMRHNRINYLQLKKSALTIQRRFRAQLAMRECRNKYQKLKKAAIIFQTRYKALQKMRNERIKFIKMKSSCVTIQKTYRAYKLGKHQRQIYLKQKESATKIQNWFRCLKKGQKVKIQYEQLRNACVTIQRIFKAYIMGKNQREEYLTIKTSTICIQKYFRSYLLTKSLRNEFTALKKSTVVIQRFYRSFKETTKQRQTYLRLKNSAILIQNYYRCYRETRKIRQLYCDLKLTTITIQQRYRSKLLMRRERIAYLKLIQTTVMIQKRYRAILAMRTERRAYLEKRAATIVLQKRYRARCLMKQERYRYARILEACKTIQNFYRACKQGRSLRHEYLRLKQATVILQQRYKAMLVMRQERQTYLLVRSAVVTIQRKLRAHQMMLQEKSKYIRTQKACITIQRFYKAHSIGRQQRQQYIKMKSAAILIQRRYREFRETKRIRYQFNKLRETTIQIQRHIRNRNISRHTARKAAVNKIQTWYLSLKRRDECRSQYINIRNRIIIMQSIIRMHICRKRFQVMRTATSMIQTYYRYYKLAKTERIKYLQLKTSITILQSYVRCYIERKRYIRIRAAILSIQAIYRLRRHRILVKRQREEAAVCIQKNIRRFLVQSWYKRYYRLIIFVQRVWRGKLVTRLTHCEYLQKKQFITKLQAVIRGYLVRKEVEHKKENLLKLREEQRRNHAAAKIQALFRGHRVRMAGGAGGAAACELRRRWRAGALQSTQASLHERNEEAMDVLRNMSDIETVIRAFQSLELLTEVFPMMYNSNAASIVRRVYIYMSVTNRSISSVEVLKSAASILVNLTRYRITGPDIYARERITPVLKFMWRFSNNETQLFCILATHLWLFSKYENVKKDLKEFLHTPENHKMLVTIKGNVNRMKRMASNTRNKFNTPQPSKFVSNIMNMSLRDNMNHSICSNSNNCSFILPTLEPDYGIIRADKPRYFEDPHQAISCLFETYGL